MNTSAVISPHHYCNSKCWMCTSLRVDRNDYVEPDYDRVITSVQELYASGVRSIHISGGEPTIWRRYKDFITFVGSVGFDSIAIYTHGRALTQTIVEHSLQAGVNTFLVSLHAADETSGDRIANARGSFRQTLRGLGELRAAKEKFSFSISISFVLSSLTESNILDVVALALSYPIDRFQFTYPLHTGPDHSLDAAMYPDLARISSDLDGAISLLRSRNVDVRVNEIPPCFYPANADCYSSASLGTDGRHLEGFHSINGTARRVRYAPLISNEIARTVSECQSCFLLPRCHGIPTTYFERFQEIKVAPLSRAAMIKIAQRLRSTKQ